MSFYKLNLSSLSIMNQQNSTKLTHQVKTALQSPSTFNRFVDNHIISPEQSHYIIKQLSEKSDSLTVQYIRPFKQLCLRYIDSEYYIAIFLNSFLKLIIRHRVFRECLEIVQMPYILQGIAQQIIDYEYNAFFIFCQLKRYGQAVKHIHRILSLLSVYPKQYLDTSKLISIFFITQAFPSQIKLEKLLSQQLSLTKQKKQIQLMISALKNPNKDLRSLGQYGNFNKKLSLLIDHKQIQSASQINQYRKDRFERVKMDKVGGNSLKKLSTMSQINQFGQLSRYSCEEGVLYLNHNLYSESEINMMISKCFKMYKVMSVGEHTDKINKLQYERFGSAGCAGMKMMF